MNQPRCEREREAGDGGWGKAAAAAAATTGQHTTRTLIRCHAALPSKEGGCFLCARGGCPGGRGLYDSTHDLAELAVIVVVIVPVF